MSRNDTYLGFKMFHKIGSNEHLTSPLYVTQWYHGEVLHASCDRASLPFPGQRFTKPYDADTNYWHSRHDAPEVECNCGFHVTWDLTGIATFAKQQKWKYQKEFFSDHVDLVVGLVEGGGNVVEHETGFRSEWATIKGLIATLDILHEDFDDLRKAGNVLQLLVELDFSSPWEVFNPGEAILLANENRKQMKETK